MPEVVFHRAQEGLHLGQFEDLHLGQAAHVESLADDHHRAAKAAQLVAHVVGQLLDGFGTILSRPLKGLSRDFPPLYLSMNIARAATSECG